MGAGKKVWGYYPVGDVWLPLRYNALGQLEVDMALVNLNDLADVNAPAPANLDLLTWNNVAGEWQNRGLDISDDLTPTLGGNLQGLGLGITNLGFAQGVERLEAQVPTNTTIVAGVIITLTLDTTVDTQGGAATDDLDNIFGMAVAGTFLVLRAFNAARTVVVRHGVGNIQLKGGRNVELDNTDKCLLLFYDGNNWLDVGLPDRPGEHFNALAGTIVYNAAGVGSTPRTATILGVVGAVITLTAPVSLNFFDPWGLMTGNVYAKIRNNNLAQYAWVQAATPNTLTVTNAADIVGWLGGHIISTSRVGAASPDYELDLTPTIGGNATAITCGMSAQDWGVVTGAESITVRHTPVVMYSTCQVSGFLMMTYPIVPVLASQHIYVRDVASGAGALFTSINCFGWFE